MVSLVRLIHYGYRMKEIAEYLGVHYATVSRGMMSRRDEIQIVGLQDLTPQF